ncbi:MAG: HEAT repeat domain-containing protein [Candidatus Omnitrophica bacterium]|nr:HEAT repeat domain-containing protein [Candidatus Omnitrophota bacterium]
MPAKGLLAVPNGIARLLGSTVRCLEKEFQYLSPSAKRQAAPVVKKPAAYNAPAPVAAVVRPAEAVRVSAPVSTPVMVKAAPVAVRSAEPVLPPVRRAEPLAAVNAAATDFPAASSLTTNSFASSVESFTPSVAVPVASPAAVVPAAVFPAATPSRVAAAQDTLLQGMIFESKAEQVKAEIYFRDLRSTNKAQRMDALREIKELSRNTMVTGLERLLALEQDTLQIIEILNVLASLGEEALGSKKLFVNYCGHSDAGVRLAALRAISKFHDDEAFDILTSFLKDKDPEVRRQMLNCLCWAFAERCLPFTLKALHDSDPGVRKAAAHIAGTLKSQLAISALISLLSDPEHEVQESASAALKKITKQDFVFKVSGSKKEKDDAIEGWRYWWRENQTRFERVKK